MEPRLETAAASGGPLLEPAASRLWQLGSSMRCRRAAETLVIARPWMAHFQITRLTDVTRMDHLGLPVCISVRASSLTLHVNAGKGLQLQDARVGALMEAIEFAVAEPQRSSWCARTLSIRDLEADWAGHFEFDDLPTDVRGAPRPGDAFVCVQCEELAEGRPAWMPADLVFMPYVSPGQPKLLRGSSTGIASGNSVDEATLHGLLEVLERDATTMNLVGDGSWWVESASLPAPFPALVRDWALRGVALAVRYVPSASGLPCFRAVLYDHESDDVRLAEGAGLHLDRSVAVSRAICEAAQSRLSCIHGGRDDIARYYVRMAAKGHASRREHALRITAALFSEERRLRFDEVPTVDTEGASLDELLAGVVRSLAAVGFPRVYRHRFRIAIPELHVVRIIVPGCEDVDDAPACIGRRLRQRIFSHA